MGSSEKPDLPVPPIEVLAEKQQVAALLASSWARVSEMMGDLSCDQVEIGQSDVHGLGLMALEDIKEGTLVTLYPVHRVLQMLPDGRATACLVEEADEEYFRPSSGVDEAEMVYRQIAYRQTYSHCSPTRLETFQIDANPTKPDLAGWLGHRINDGASLSPGNGRDEDLLEYYRTSGLRRNLCPVALCVPLIGFVTTRFVPKGTELFATYGHGYWLQEDTPFGEDVQKALDLPSREAVLWQIATDKKYRKQIAALDQFISQTSSQDIQTHLPRSRGDDGETASVSSSAAQSSSTRVRPDKPAASGFGGTSNGSSSGPPQGKRKGIKKKSRK